MENQEAQKSFLEDDLTVSNKMAQPRENPPKGPRHFVITHVIAAGTHVEQFPGKPAVSQKKVICLYELKDRRLDGKRFVRNRKWTFSMDDRAKMRKDLAGLGIDTSKDFALKSLVGRNGMVNVMHETMQDGSTKVSEGPMTELMEGIPLISPEADLAVIPEWAQAYIAESPEYIQKHGKGAVGPYAEAIKKAADRKAGKPQQAASGSAIPPQDDSELPF